MAQITPLYSILALHCSVLKVYSTATCATALGLPNHKLLTGTEQTLELKYYMKQGRSKRGEGKKGFLFLKLS